MKKITFLFLVLFLISSCSGGDKLNVEEITFSTQDKEVIAANFYRANSPVGAILVHQLSADKSTYNDLATELQKNNINALAIDLRGHGKSSGELALFSKEDFNNMQLDVQAAKNYLENSGVNKIFVVGASIGANTAINFGVSNPDVLGVVALSPGLDYRGVETSQNAKKISVPVLIVVSNEDSYAFQSSNTLYSELKGDKNLKIYKGAGHGTNMFSSTDADKVILDWILKHT